MPAYTLDIEKRGELTGHQNPVFAVENGPLPEQLFTAGNDKGVVQWNLETMAFVRVLLPVQSSVYALYHVSGTPWLAVGERSGLVTLADTVTGKPVARLQHHQKPVFDINMLTGKNELLVSSEDGSVSVWSLKDFRLLYHFRVSGQTVRAIAVSTNERLLAFGSKDGTVSVYRSEDYSLKKVIREHQMGITALCFSPDGRYLLSGGRDARINAFHSSDFSLANSFTPHLFSVYGIAYHPQLPLFATASRDKSIKFWHTADSRLLRTISREKNFVAHRLSVNNIVWNRMNDQLVSVSDDKTVMVWDVKVTGNW